ncbi:hypothetical protein [Glycomyces arizonensis]|uniref:hypothetical protein n=1 Tax=Glycomyces arizonensis TaxID=256035 RepID=UPI000402ACC0|nr:hypothetical protein [Glycomyces arizonensis]
MSSFNGPQQYNIEPGSPQGGAQPPPAQQPPQPYVEQPPPGAYGGQQPPYQPPGGYTPMPPPGPPPRRRRSTVIVATTLSVVLVAAIGAFVFFNFFWTSGPDPAERFPASASMYLELNLDPSFDQTPKLIEHLNKFEGLDYDDTNDIIADLLEESGLEGVDADEDIASWLGRRHGMAMWEHDGAPYAVVNLASTDSGAAEAGLANIREASGVTEDQWAYTVNDDSVLMVAGDEGAAAALEAAESEAGSSPLSSSSQYEEARSWLDGDQLAVYWVDVDAVGDMAAAMGGEDVFTGVESMYSGHGIVGLSAFDDGFELSYRLFGEEDDPWTGSEELLDDMGQMPASDIVAVADIPDNLAEVSEEWMSDLEGLGGETETGTEPAEGEGPLTDAEYEEYLTLDEQWWNDTLAPEDEGRYYELEERYWAYGTEDEPLDGGYDDSGAGYEEFLGSAEEVIDLLSGAQLSFAADFPAEGEEFDPESVFASVLLAEDRAEDLDALITEMASGEELPEGIEVDGSELSYEGGAVAGGALADDDRFSDFAADAPDSAALGIWVDLADVGSYAEEAEPLSAFAWAHGTVDGDGTGLARLYLK